jgi:protein required for attachment to host cells
MNTVWVLVCDAAKATFFEVRAPEPAWHIVEVLTHPEARSKASELVSDHSGRRSSEGASVHHNSLTPSSSPKQVEKEHFVHLLATRLDQAMRSKRFRRWVLVASPHVAGMLRKDLTPELQKHLMATVDKDLNHLDPHELQARLRDIVRLPLEDRDTVREADKRRH